MLRGLRKRTKFILGIVGIGIVVLSGALFGLAKYGVIDLKMLADTVLPQTTSGRVEITVDPTNVVSGGNIVLKLNNAVQQVSGSYSGNTYIIPSLAYGSYTYQIGMPGPDDQPCTGLVKSLSHNSSTTRDTYPQFSCNGISPAPASVQGVITKSGSNLTIQGATITIGDKPSVASDQSGNYSVTGLTAGNYTATIVKSGYDTLTQTGTLADGVNPQNFSLVQTGTQTPHELTLYIGVKTDCTDTVCTNRDPYGKIGGIPVSFGSLSGATNNSLSQGYNLQFSNVMTGNYTFKINDTTATGYNSAYESKTVTEKNIYDPTGSTIVEFNLVKKTVTPGEGAYSLQGFVKDSQAGTALSGVTVNGANATDSAGKYSILNLQFSPATNQTFTFHKDGYADQTKTLAQLGITAGNIIPNQPVPYAATLTNLVPNQSPAKLVSVVGVVGLQNISFLKDVQFKLTKPNGQTLLATSDERNLCDTVRIYRTGCNYYFNEFEIADGTYKLEALYDQSKYSLSAGLEIYNFNASNSGIIAIPGQDNHYYIRFENLLKLRVDDIEERFSFAAEVLYNGEPIENIGLEIKLEPAAFTKIAISQKENIWPEFVGNKIANLVVENIPKQNEYSYIARIPDKVVDGKRYKLDPADEFYMFSSSDLRYNDDTQEYYFFKVFNLISEGVIEKKIQYFDASTGLSIDLTKENIYYDRNKVMCSLLNNNLSECQRSANILEGLANNSVMRYVLSTEQVTQSLNLTFETQNYIYTGGDLSPYNTIDHVYLINKADKNGSIACRNISGVDFCSYKAIENEVFSADRLVKLEYYALILKTLAYYVGITKYPDVYLIGDEYRAFQRGNNLNINNLDSQEIFSMSNYDIDNRERGIEVVVHEFGHVIDSTIGLSSQYYNEFEAALKAGQGLKHDGTPILGIDGQPVKSCQNIFDSYQCFSSYAITTNSHELWAEFFAFWILHNDQINEAINSTDMKKPENEHCRKTLMFLDWLMESQFPKLKAFRQSSDTSSQGLDSEKQSSPFISKAYAAFDDSQFLQFMSESGYQSAPLRTYSTIAPLVNLNLKPEDIAKGIWLNENYSQLPRAEKLQLQLSIQGQKAKNLIAKYGNLTVDAIRTSLVAINGRVEQLLIALGFNISNTRISGKVEDQDGSVAGLMVKFSDKSAITGPNGRYSISRTRTGTLPFQLSDPKINRNFTVYPSSLTLSSNQKMDNVNILFSRKHYTLSGQVMIGDTPLRNGKITIVGGQTYNLNNEGKFNFKLKEGQYKLIIKNKNGRTMEIVNPGTFGNFSKLQITKDYDSLIWVK